MTMGRVLPNLEDQKHLGEILKKKTGYDGKLGKLGHHQAYTGTHIWAITYRSYGFGVSDKPNRTHSTWLPTEETVEVVGTLSELSREPKGLPLNEAHSTETRSLDAQASAFLAQHNALDNFLELSPAFSAGIFADTKVNGDVNVNSKAGEHYSYADVYSLHDFYNTEEGQQDIADMKAIAKKRVSKLKKKVQNSKAKQTKLDKYRKALEQGKTLPPHILELLELA